LPAAFEKINGVDAVFFEEGYSILGIAKSIADMGRKEAGEENFHPFARAKKE